MTLCTIFLGTYNKNISKKHANKQSNGVQVNKMEQTGCNGMEQKASNQE